MFPVKHTVIYTFFAITSVQNTCFCSVFNALASKNPAKSCYVQCFFIFGRFSIAGKLPKWPKIPFQYPLALRHPKILEKCRKHHRILVSVRNPFWPPPAKADIATAILTNVIEHLVLLLPPNKHAFTAKAVWADFSGLFFREYTYWLIPFSQDDWYTQNAWYHDPMQGGKMGGMGMGKIRQKKWADRLAGTSYWGLLHWLFLGIFLSGPHCSTEAWNRG